MVSEWIERRPSFGIITSFSGFGVALLSWIHVASIVLGCVGAVFGALAGFYTFLIKRNHWQKIKNHH